MGTVSHQYQYCLYGGGKRSYQSVPSRLLTIVGTLDSTLYFRISIAAGGSPSNGLLLVV